jgi:hypothetical protein
MRSEFSLVRLLFFLMVPIISLSQTNIDKTAQKVEDGAKLLNNVKGLFKKKKNKDSTNIVKDTPQSDKNSKSSNSPFLSSSVIWAGKITPSTKMIDCDEMSEINDGAVVIKKGNSFAIIDTSGNFLVPFNKYKEIELNSVENTGVNNSCGGGIIRARDNFGKNHFLNSKGNVIFSETELWGAVSGSLSFDHKLLVIESRDKKTNTTTLSLMDNKGKKYPTNVVFNEYFKNDNGNATTLVTDSVTTYYVWDNKGWGNKYGFKNINGKGLTPQFDQLDRFHNGVAVYMKKNEFGESRWGIVNKDGIFVTPPQFTNRPSQFYHGIAFVEAAKGANFKSALINTKAEVIYKNTSESIEKYGEFDLTTEFQEGYTSNMNHILDINGKVYAKNEFAKILGIQLNANNQNIEIYLKPPRIPIYDGQIRFLLRQIDYDRNKNETHYGVYNVKTKETTIAKDAIDNLMYRDPVSGLRHVKVKIDQKDSDGKEVILEGHINDAGEFVLLKGKPKSDW